MSNGQYNLKMTKIRIKFTNIESQSGLSIPHCCVPLYKGPTLTATNDDVWGEAQ